MKVLAGVASVLVMLVAGCGGDDSSDASTTIATTVTPGSGEAAIVEVINGFEYYNPCQNSSIDINGTMYYVVPGEQMATEATEIPEIDESRYPHPAEPQGFAKVLPPGPGDDVGTMVVYDDGIARFESDSGIVSWFTVDEIEYGWVC